MKNLFFISFFFLIACSKHDLDAVRSIHKEYKHAPPGTIWLSDSLFIDQAEVRNLDYLEFTRWTQKHDPSNYAQTLPDTMVWKEALAYFEPYTNMYFWHPAYRNFPVVGISYEQASAFCKWRTDRVLEIDSTCLGKTYPKGFYYRLPTQKEWEVAASAETGLDFGYYSLHARDNSPNFNVKETSMLQYPLAKDITIPVRQQRPNRFGLYNTIGNVAEMVSERGICKGGDWMHSLRDAEIGDSIPYDGPKAWLGFRCVAVWPMVRK